MVDDGWVYDVGPLLSFLRANSIFIFLLLLKTFLRSCRCIKFALPFSILHFAHYVLHCVYEITLSMYVLINGNALQFCSNGRKE